MTTAEATSTVETSPRQRAYELVDAAETAHEAYHACMRDVQEAMPTPQDATTIEALTAHSDARLAVMEKRCRVQASVWQTAKYAIIDLLEAALQSTPEHRET